MEPYGHYPRENIPGQGPITEVENRMLTELKMLSAYTATDDRIEAEASSSRRHALRSFSPGNNSQNEHRRQGREGGHGGGRNRHAAQNQGGQGHSAREGSEIVSIAPANKDGGPASEAMDINAPTAIGREADQVWAYALVRHQTRTSCRISVEVLVDTAAGGGNYASAASVHYVEHSGRGGAIDDQSTGTTVVASGQPQDQHDSSDENRGVMRAAAGVYTRGQGAQSVGKTGRRPPVRRADHRGGVPEEKRKRHQLRSWRRVQTGTRVATGTVYLGNGRAFIEERGQEGHKLAGSHPTPRGRNRGDHEQGNVGAVLRRQAAWGEEEPEEIAESNPNWQLVVEPTAPYYMELG